MHILFYSNAVFKLIKRKSQYAMLVTLYMQYLHFFRSENRKQRLYSLIQFVKRETPSMEGTGIKEILESGGHYVPLCWLLKFELS
jgi:hypothetical protein